MSSTNQGRFIQVYIPPHRNKSFDNRKHQNKNNWKNIIYYRNKKRNVCFPEQIVDEMTTCGQHRADTFYKVISLSNDDEVFDYYRILKSVSDEITNIGCKTTHKREYRRDILDGSQCLTITRYPKDNPYILKFA